MRLEDLAKMLVHGRPFKFIFASRRIGVFGKEMGMLAGELIKQVLSGLGAIIIKLFKSLHDLLYQSLVCHIS